MITLFCQEISEYRYDISISESCVDPNPLMVERQDPDNFTRFQTWGRCALEIAVYVFKEETIENQDRYTCTIKHADSRMNFKSC